jgi:short-subunit dehydrogenase
MANSKMNILITGATDGIGLALAKHYQAQNMRLILVGRKSLSELDNTFFNESNYCQADLTSPTCADEIKTWLIKNQIHTLDVTFHNAGLGWYGNPNSQPADSIDALLQVNVYAPIAITHTLFPMLKQVVFISSVAANAPAPLYAVYAATKSALDGFARSLRVESQTTLHVQVIHIGAARTSMHTKIGVAEKLNAQKFPSAEWTVERIAQAVAQGGSEKTIGGINQLLRWLGLHFPNLIDTLAGKRL